VDSLKKYIRNIPDFPKKGIQFKDITPLLADARAFALTVDTIAFRYHEQGVEAVAGIESRGFLFAAPIAQKLGVGVIPVRKRGKLPWKARSLTYDLEYGQDTIEAHEDAVRPGQKVLCVDDLLATGGTMAACVRLLEELGAKVVSCAFVIELTPLNGRQRLDGHDVFSLLTYDEC